MTFRKNRSTASVALSSNDFFVVYSACGPPLAVDDVDVLAGFTVAQNLYGTDHGRFACGGKAKNRNRTALPSFNVIRCCSISMRVFMSQFLVVLLWNARVAGIAHVSPHQPQQ